MSKSEWKEVYRMFWATLDQPKEEREAFLKKSCGDRQPLYEAVHALLEADEEASKISGFMEAPPMIPDLTDTD